MAGVGFSDVDAFGLLQERYGESKRYQEFISNSLFKTIRRARPGEVKLDGKSFNVPVQLQYNESYASINDREHLPEADVQKDIFAKYQTKLSYSTAEATHFAGTRGHAGGRVGGKYLDDLEKNTLIPMLSGINHDLYGNGRGYRAKIDTATPGAGSFTTYSSMRIRPGMRFDWYDSTYTVLKGTIKIALKGTDRMIRQTFIDSTFGTSAVPVGAANGDVLVITNALAANEPADGRYALGLSGIIDNSRSLGQLSPSQYAQWQATIINASFGNPTQELLQLAWDSIYSLTGMYSDKMIIPTAQKRAYLSNFLGQRTFSSNNFDTGASSLTWDPLKMGRDEKNKRPGKIDIVEDKDCDPDRIYFWSDEVLCIATDLYDEPTVADEDGTEWRKRVGYDADMMFMRFWWNTVCFQRNGVGAITNLAIPSGTL